MVVVMSAAVVCAIFARLHERLRQVMTHATSKITNPAEQPATSKSRVVTPRVSAAIEGESAATRIEMEAVACVSRLEAAPLSG